jgi:DNA (cytosine-5)-methyltransferase 1
MSKLITVSLFSGCAGSDIGAKNAGAEIIFVNDNNTDAIKTYKKYQHLAAVDGTEIKKGNIADIKSFPPCDLLIGCYPCQSFTMGGPRSPDDDPRSDLYLEFKRCLADSNPLFFVTENVPGLAWLNGGNYLKKQLECFCKAGKGYNVSLEIVNAKEYGVPQDRRRLILVGMRKDLGLYYRFPDPTHGPSGSGLLPWASHGDAIAELAIEAEGEYYDYPAEPFSWWYMSRNRKRRWEAPSYTIQANWRHVPLHPASPTMYMVESNLKHGFKQRWEFTDEYDHLKDHPKRPKLEKPRRLSWRECAAIQTFPPGFEPIGSVVSKYRQIGNATPPLLMEAIIKEIVGGTAFQAELFKPRAKSLA